MVAVMGTTVQTYYYGIYESHGDGGADSLRDDGEGDGEGHEDDVRHRRREVGDGVESSDVSDYE